MKGEEIDLIVQTVLERFVLFLYTIELNFNEIYIFLFYWEKTIKVSHLLLFHFLIVIRHFKL